MFGMPGNSRSFKEPIIHILRFRDGKVCEHWRVENELGMVKQLGRLPDSFQ
jgi:predicted ester cyclase